MDEKLKIRKMFAVQESKISVNTLKWPTNRIAGTYMNALLAKMNRLKLQISDEKIGATLAMCAKGHKGKPKGNKMAQTDENKPSGRSQ